MSPKSLYLLDVEGTVAPISLVTEQLFPYARTHAHDFILRNCFQSDASIDDDLVLLWQENQAETDPTSPRLPHPSSSGIDRTQFPSVALMYMNWLMDRDRKSTALKSLQGKIWKAGFESGELQGTLFPDVPEAFARWSAKGKVAIYSSGSTEAQRLLFRHSNYGDLTAHIAGYFDTRIGAKADAASYSAIAAAMRIEPAQGIFFSDALRELDAARQGGLDTRLVMREGNAAVDDAHDHEPVLSLEGI